jgi:putative flippase GtrA
MNAPFRIGGSPARDAIIGLLVTESAKYFLVSVAALAVDYGLLVSLTEFAGLNYLVSAAISFTAGLVLNYILSVRFVFRERRLESKRLEMLGFALIGLAALALNEMLMMALVGWAGLGYALAKLPATGIGFIFNFGVRRAFLFTKAHKRSRLGDPVLLTVPEKAAGSL